MVSIILPVGNSLFLEEVLLDIVQQDYSNWELIALIDNSDISCIDKLEKIVPAEKLIILEFTSPFNLAQRLNAAIDRSRGEFVARIDADDRYQSARLSSQVQYLREDENAEVAVLGTWAKVINQKSEVFGHIKLPINVETVRKRFMYRNSVLHPSVMIRSSVLKEFRYNENTARCQDLELWLRILSKHDVGNIGAFLMDYRIHDGNHSAKRLGLTEIILVSRIRWELVRKNKYLFIHFLVGNSIWMFKNILIGPTGLQKIRKILSYSKV